jgi:hypothetical protein
MGYTPGGRSFTDLTRSPGPVPQYPLLSVPPVLSESRKRDINVVRGSMDVPESP